MIKSALNRYFHLEDRLFLNAHAIIALAVQLMKCFS